MHIPALLRQNIVGSWGDQGRRWLDELPELVAGHLGTWKLTFERPFSMTYHWVGAVRLADGTPAVLKIGVPDGHQDAEAQALRLFDGQGAVRLLAEDLPRGALLIERAEPGTTAAVLPDEEATARIIEVGRKLHRPAPADGPLPSPEKYTKDLFVYADGWLPPHWVHRAAALLGELCADAPDPVVLHGDFHHDNVLLGRPGEKRPGEKRAGEKRAGEKRPGDGRDGDGRPAVGRLGEELGGKDRNGEWLAIDPHGLAGDPGFDCSTMLYNPLAANRDPALTRLVPGRIEQLADGFGIPVERVAAWGFVMAVLSEVWTASVPGAVPTRAFDVAELLSRRRF